MLPSRPRRMSFSLAWGWRFRISSAVMIIPGVQKPHCRPWYSQKASWSGWSFPSVASPSMVVTSLPSAWRASTVQDLTAMPSISTVQAPHWLVSQPILVPVRPSTSRRYPTSNKGGSIWWVRSMPFTLMDRASFMRVPPGGRLAFEPYPEKQEQISFLDFLFNATEELARQLLRDRLHQPGGEAGDGSH